MSKIYLKYISIFTLNLIILLFSLAALADTITVIPDVKLKPKKNVSDKNNTTLSTTEFSQSDITQSPVINLSQFLTQEQSVVRLTNNSGDASQTALSLRGFGDNAAANSLILVDGFPLINPSLLAPNFNSIPLSDIERIEIYQGSEGSLWGNQAVGGVVNIITKHPTKFISNSILSVGSYNSYYDNILIGDKFKNELFYKTFGLIGKTNNYRDHNLQEANNIFAQIGKDYSHGTLNVNVQSYGDTVYFPGGLSQEQFLQNPRQATEFNNYSRYRTNVIQLLNKHELNNNWLLETRVDHHETEGNGFVYVNFTRNDSLTSINPRLIGNINENKIILGYTGQQSNYQLFDSKVQTKASATENDLYLQTTIPITKKIDFIVGARQAWQQNQVAPLINQSVNSLNQVFVTEEGFTFHPSEAISFFLRRDGNFSFPKADESAWLPDNVRSLQVQTGTSYETGTTWQTNKSKSQLTLYHLTLTNEIAFNPLQTASQPFGAYNNLDNTVRNGISVAEQYQLFSKVKINGQINYVEAKFASGALSGNSIPAVPAINGNAGLTYNWTERWITQYNLLYTGSRYASDDIENMGSKVPGYWLSDISIQYLIKAFILSFDIHNVFNKQYANYVYYDAITNQNTYYPAAGRNYLLTLKINID